MVGAELVCNRSRPGVGPEEGGVSRQNWHHNRGSTGDLASARQVGGFWQARRDNQS